MACIVGELARYLSALNTRIKRKWWVFVIAQWVTVTLHV